tara:strand:- start:108 stop:959 length:852 start_codon:yes stop_codon:yes gene_type:complete
MKSSSAKKNMNQALSLGSRPITRKNLPKLPLRTFDGWFTATEGITKNPFNIPNTVSGWANLVPDGADFAQSTSNKQPQLTTINGLTALAPDGASGRGAATDILVEGDMIDNIGTGDFYIGMVYELETAGSFGSRTTIISKLNGTGSNGFNIQVNASQMDWRIGASVHFAASGLDCLDRTIFLEIVRTDGTVKVYENGTEKKSVSFSTDLSCDGDLQIGASDMKIGEFICKKGTMPDRTRQMIEALMATKWNIGSVSTQSKRGRAAGFGSLPASNRFRNRPPRF